MANDLTINRLFAFFALLIGLTVSVPAYAGSLAVKVSDANNAALENAIVFLTPQFALSSPKPLRDDAEMRQQGILFAPEVLPVQVGTKVSFPNFDESRHHVYSFSKPKRFELQLYGKDESNSIIFDKSGVVAIGCNIHDNMLAYIYVTEAPIFAKTNAGGVANFTELENGDYEMTVWHPGARRKGAPAPVIISIGDDRQQKDAQIRLKRVWGAQREPDENPY